MAILVTPDDWLMLLGTAITVVAFFLMFLRGA
jgi:hypothetical protein